MANAEHFNPAETEPAEREQLIVFCLHNREAQEVSQAFADVPSVELGYIYYPPIVEGRFTTPRLMRPNGVVDNGLGSIEKLATTRRVREKDRQDEFEENPSSNYAHWKNRLWPVDS